MTYVKASTKTKLTLALALALVLALFFAVGMLQLQAEAQSAPTVEGNVLYLEGERNYRSVQFDPYHEWASQYYLHIYDDGGAQVAAIAMQDPEGDGVYTVYVPERYKNYIIADNANLSAATKKTEPMTKLEKPKSEADGNAVNTYVTNDYSMIDSTTYAISRKMYSAVWNDVNGNYRMDAGESVYDTIDFAFRNAPNGAKLVLAGSQISGADLNGKDLSVDLNGYNIEVPYINNVGFLTVRNGSRLVIEDRIGTARVDGSYSYVSVTLDASGSSWVDIKGGHFVATDRHLFYPDPSCEIWISPGVTTNIKPLDNTYIGVRDTEMRMFLHFIENDFGYWEAVRFSLSEAAAFVDENGNKFFDDGDEIAYYTFEDAVSAVTYLGKGTVSLLKDVTVKEQVTFNAVSGNGEYILDLYGYSIRADEGFLHYTIIDVNGANLTVRSSMNYGTPIAIDASAKKGLALLNVSNGEITLNDPRIELRAHAETDQPISYNTKNGSVQFLSGVTNFDPYYILKPDTLATKKEGGYWKVGFAEIAVAYEDANGNGSFDIGENRFGDLSHALAFGGNVVLLADVVYEKTSASEINDFTYAYTRLDLNGHTVTVAEGDSLSIKGTNNVIYDSSADKSGVLDARLAQYVLTGPDSVRLGDTVIEGGTFYTGGKEFHVSSRTLYIANGYFDFDPSDYLDKASTATYDAESGLWHAYMSFEAFNDTNRNGTLDDGETTYTKLMDAVSAGVAYITLASDVEDLYQGIELFGGDRTINLNGYYIYTRSSLSVLFKLNNSAKLTLTTTRGGGIHTKYSLAFVNNYATLTIVDGDYKGRPYAYDDAVVSIQGGSFDADYSWLLEDGFVMQEVDGAYVVRKDAAALFTPTFSETYFYTGEALTPVPTVTDGKGNTLFAGVDYTLSYTNNTAVGTATVTVTYTLEGYAGTETVTFAIEKRALTVSPEDASVAEGESFTGSSLQADGLAAGHTVQATFGEFDTSCGGSYAILLGTVTVLDADGKDVTANYAIEKKDGTLTVLHSESASADGFYACCDSYEVPTLAEDGYYELKNAGNLFWFAAHVNAGNKTANARLAADIDLANRAWTVIAPTALYYKGYGADLGYAGCFDGQGHVIKNLALASSATEEGSVGLFGTVSGTVKNLGINGVSFTDGGMDFRVGAIVGQLIKSGLVSDCYVIGAVINPGDHVAGGIAGCVYEGTVQNCFVLNSTVSGAAKRFGTLVGDLRADGGATDRVGKLINCYSDSEILYGTGNLGTVEKCATVTAAQASSGELALLLGIEVWGQKLGTDAHPTVGGMKLYLTVPCATGVSNSENTVKEHTYSHACDTVCTACGEVGRTDTEHTYDSICDADCNACGEVREDIHSFDHACDAHCDLCGHDREITHALDGATCTLCGHTVTYVEYAWDASGKQLTSLKKTPNGFTLITDTTTSLTDGWYVVNGSVTLNGRITVTGDVRLILMDGSRLTVNGGIHLTGEGNSLTVYGEENSSGILTAVPTANYMAGIGGNRDERGGILTVHGGVIAASGGEYGAGIGSAYGSSSDPKDGGIFTLYGGTVTATGGRYGAGLGGGYNGNGATVTVYGGTLNASSYPTSYGNGIGAGYKGSVGTVRIFGGTVTAIGYSGGIASASHYYEADGLIEIHGGTVVATAINSGAGIGAGDYSHAGTILITGGHITATGASYSAGIGGSSVSDQRAGYSITITGGTVIATGGNSPIGGAAGIGGGPRGNGNGQIFISGGHITATGGKSTNGGGGAAGIGGGGSGHGGLIVITGGEINAIPGVDGEPIGNGANGLGYAYFTATDGIIHTAHTFVKDFILAPGVTLVIPSTATLTVAEGVTLYNNGKVTVEGGIFNYGSIVCADTSHSHISSCDTHCRFCGEENTSATAHTYPHSCSLICTDCGFVRTEAEDSHSYVHGICSACGEYQPAALDTDSESATYGYYKIANRGNLLWFRDFVNSGNPSANAVLVASVDLMNEEFAPIATEIYRYSGIFDGAGYTVSGLKMTAGGNNIGFFRFLAGGTVKNLTVKGEMTVSANVNYIGGLVGYMSGTSVLENCHIYVNITLTEAAVGTAYIGGVVGYLADNGSTFNACTYHGNLQADGASDYVGGIVSHINGKNTLTNCANYGTVYAPQAQNVGGIIAYGGYSFGGLRNCLGIGDVTGARYVGRLVGYSGAGASNTDYSNNYYLEGQKGYGHSIYSNELNSSKAILASEVQMKNGEVAYLLGSAWGQSIGTDAYPVLGGSTVYRAENTNCQGEPAGSYTYGNSETVTPASGLHSYDEHGACTLCDEAYTAITVQGGITLGGSFGINYYPTGDKKATEMGVTYNGKDYPVSGEFAVISGIAAKNLGDRLTVIPYQVIDGVRYIGEEVTASPAELLMAYVNGDYSEEVKAVAIASLNYGAAAQVYFEYQTESLVNASLTEEQRRVTHGTDYAQQAFIATLANPTAKIISMTLLLNETINLKTVILSNVENVKLEIATNEGFVGSVKLDFVVTEGGGSLKAIMDGITPAYWNTPFYFRVVDADGNVLSNTLRYSVAAYCQNMKENAKVAPVADAILALYDAVAAYAA